MATMTVVWDVPDPGSSTTSVTAADRFPAASTAVTEYSIDVVRTASAAARTRSSKPVAVTVATSTPFRDTTYPATGTPVPPAAHRFPSLAGSQDRTTDWGETARACTLVGGVGGVRSWGSTTGVDGLSASSAWR